MSEKLPDGREIRPYDPASQSQLVRERLHGLDIINQRFARDFRIRLFNLIRHNADVTADGLRYETYDKFVGAIPEGSSLNVIAMHPLRGNALVVFPPDLIYMIVDGLFGGDGRPLDRPSGREFTRTEQRVIRRILDLALSSYQECWKAVRELEIAYQRSEVQARFANITNSQNEIVVTSAFRIEAGAHLDSHFYLCAPYSMIEPLRSLLVHPGAATRQGADSAWQERIAGRVRGSDVRLRVDFVGIDSDLRGVAAMKPGDVLPVDRPDLLTACVDGTPIIECRYGAHAGRIVLIVERVLSQHHSLPAQRSADQG